MRVYGSIGLETLPFLKLCCICLGSCVFRRFAAVFRGLRLCSGGLQLCVTAICSCVFRRFAAVCSGGLRLCFPADCQQERNIRTDWTVSWTCKFRKVTGSNLSVIMGNFITICSAQKFYTWTSKIWNFAGSITNGFFVYSLNKLQVAKNPIRKLVRLGRSRVRLPMESLAIIWKICRSSKFQYVNLQDSDFRGFDYRWYHWLFFEPSAGVHKSYT
jgi:hypothetical protein